MQARAEPDRRAPFQLELPAAQHFEEVGLKSDADRAVVDGDKGSAGCSRPRILELGPVAAVDAYLDHARRKLTEAPVDALEAGQGNGELVGLRGGHADDVRLQTTPRRRLGA